MIKNKSKKVKYLFIAVSSLILITLLVFTIGKKYFNKEIGNIGGNMKEELSRGSRLFIEKGLQFQAWVPTDEITREKKWMIYPGAEQLMELGLTAIQYNDPPNYNSELHEEYKKLQEKNSDIKDLKWGITWGPFGKHISSTSKEDENNKTGGPKEKHYNNGFLSDEQLANLDNLINICFGDEEDYSDILIENLKEWFEVSQKHYPNVLVHHNEIGGGGSQGGTFDENKLRKYVRKAKPDFLTYDLYYFREQNEKKRLEEQH